MIANKPPVLRLRMADVSALRLRSTGLETLRPLVGSGPTPLGHERTSDYAFLAVDASRSYPGALREVVRSFVFLQNEATLVNCDIAGNEPPAAVDWTLEGAEAGQLSVIQPRHAKAARRGAELVVSCTGPSADKLFLNVIHTAAAPETGEIDSSDLAGLRIADRVILFNTETRMANSAVSFDVAGPPALKFLITGLAPGAWEVWRGGYLEIPDTTVEKESGTLDFESKPGSYFLRHL
jgi:Heparinase II C-terminal domain